MMQLIEAVLPCCYTLEIALEATICRVSQPLSSYNNARFTSQIVLFSRRVLDTIASYRPRLRSTVVRLLARAAVSLCCCLSLAPRPRVPALPSRVENASILCSRDSFLTLDSRRVALQPCRLLLGQVRQTINPKLQTFTGLAFITLESSRPRLSCRMCFSIMDPCITNCTAASNTRIATDSLYCLTRFTEDASPSSSESSISRARNGGLFKSCSHGNPLRNVLVRWCTTSPRLFGSLDQHERLSVELEHDHKASRVGTVMSLVVVHRTDDAPERLVQANG